VQIVAHTLLYSETSSFTLFYSVRFFYFQMSFHHTNNNNLLLWPKLKLTSRLPKWMLTFITVRQIPILMQDMPISFSWIVYRYQERYLFVCLFKRSNNYKPLKHAYTCTNTRSAFREYYQYYYVFKHKLTFQDCFLSKLRRNRVSILKAHESVYPNF